jgi:hypothetical protein
LSQPVNPFLLATAPAEPAHQPAPQQAPQTTTNMGANPFGPAVPQAAPAPAPAPAPPQAYAQPAQPAQPQYGAPQGYPQQQAAPAAYAPQQYPQGQPQYAPQPQAAQAAPPAALDPSMLRGAPAPVVGEGRGAKLAHMYGRLVLVFPLSIARKPRNPQFITPEQRQRGDMEQEQITATFVVLDDGQGGMQPIRFGGDPSAFPPVPDTESAALPYVRKGLWVTQSRVISQLRDFLPDPASGRAGGMICGRMVKTGPQRNDPWYITTATEQELALAGQYMQLVSAGTYPHPLA